MGPGRVDAPAAGQHGQSSRLRQVSAMPLPTHTYRQPCSSACWAERRSLCSCGSCTCGHACCAAACPIWPPATGQLCGCMCMPLSLILVWRLSAGQAANAGVLASGHLCSAAYALTQTPKSVLLRCWDDAILAGRDCSSLSCITDAVQRPCPCSPDSVCAAAAWGSMRSWCVGLQDNAVLRPHLLSSRVNGCCCSVGFNAQLVDWVGRDSSSLSLHYHRVYSAATMPLLG